MEASGSAKPLVVKRDGEYWIYVFASGGRVSNNQSSYLYAYKYRR